MRNIVLSNNYELFRYIFADVGDVIFFPYDNYKASRLRDFILIVAQHIPFIRITASYHWNRKLIKEWEKGDSINTIIIINTVLANKKMNDKLFSLLKKSNIHTILFVVDSINRIPEKHRRCIFKYSKYFDTVYTFDSVDANRFKWKHNYCYYSKLQNIMPLGRKTKALCILYAGDNDRLAKTIALWDKLQSYNLDCFFSINGVDKEDLQRYYRPGIIFNHYYSYPDIVGMVLQTEIIIEIIREGQNGNTLRTFEAVVYNRKLLTNWSGINTFPYYDSRFMKVFGSVDSLDKIEDDFWKSNSSLDYQYNGDFSPRYLIDKEN